MKSRLIFFVRSMNKGFEDWYITKNKREIRKIMTSMISVTYSGRLETPGPLLRPAQSKNIKTTEEAIEAKLRNSETMTEVFGLRLKADNNPREIIFEIIAKGLE
jgi:ferric iron reductase protein FhuF